MEDDIMRGATPVLALPAHRATMMGIDASLTATGVAILSKGKIKHFVLSPPKGMDRGAARLFWFYHEFTELLARYKPVFVAIEGYSFGSKNGREALGELGGILRMALFNANREPLVVPPTSLKTFATGSGNAPKDQVMMQAYKRWGIETGNNNECDACVLAIMGLAVQSGFDRGHFTQAQQSALAKLI